MGSWIALCDEVFGASEKIIVIGVKAAEYIKKS
jgi:hypothetical protein